MDEPEEGALKDVIVPGSLGRRLGEFGLGILWALFCLMNFFPPSHHAMAPWLFGPLGGLASLHFVWRAFDRRPRLVVNSEGIMDRTAPLGGSLFIPWSQVLEVSAGRYGGRVSLLVRDPAAVWRQAGVMRRLWMKLGAVLGLRAVPISVTVLGLKERLDSGLLEFERRELGLGSGRRPSPSRQLPDTRPDGRCAELERTRRESKSEVVS